ncbi:probable carboxylesterase 5 [Chenopodium quinoa]|uniref:probable carboxylesterase 5 n=1 Tax=Chenopodium quinoa TaxID=63459 RepID=UPI000B7951FE|nr:probable carboxylesterase 5 [Chenopodium quinoa]
MNSSSINSSKSERNYSEADIAKKFLFFNVLKDGRVHVFTSIFEKSPPSDHPVSTPGVETKDVNISPDISARIFLPTSAVKKSTGNKLPLLFYIHGGGFCMQSAFSVEYSLFVSLVVAEAKVIAVSVEYSLFPKRCIPACYDDCWDALQWVASHCKGLGPEPLINDHADLGRIFVGGDSAGGNISHNILAKAGVVQLLGDVKVEGMILIHPFFCEGEPMWMYMCPTNQGPRDHRLSPSVEDLARIGCDRVLVVVAGMDSKTLYDAGINYVDDLIKSGWKGTVAETMENKGKEHCFHLYDSLDPEAAAI